MTPSAIAALGDTLSGRLDLAFARHWSEAPAKRRSSSCGTSRPEPTPAELGASARLTGAAALVCVVLLAWGGPVRGSEVPLSLAECVQQAVENNPTLAAQAWVSQAAEGALSGAIAERRPRFDLSFDVTRSERAQRVAPPSYSGENIYTDRDLIIAETRMRVPIYQGGGIKARVQQADLALMASRQELITDKQRLILDVVAIYTRLQEQWATIRALDANRNALQENLAVVNALEEVGRVPHLDALKVEVRLAALVQQASQADRNLAILRIRLGRLMGLATDEPQPEVSSDSIEIQTCRVEDEPDIVSIAVEQRPEVRAARARVDKALAEVTVARSQGRPGVNGVVAYSYRSGVPWTNLEEVDRHVSYLWAGVGVNVPLWTGGRTGAAVAEAEALRRSAEADLEALRLEVGEQVKQALATLQEARDRVGVARTAAIQANEALAIEQSSYEIGRAVVNDVLDAQAALLEAQLDQASALADVTLSSAALEYTIGNDLQQAIQRDKGGCP